MSGVDSADAQLFSSSLFLLLEIKPVNQTGTFSRTFRSVSFVRHFFIVPESSMRQSNIFLSFQANFRLGEKEDGKMSEKKLSFVQELSQLYYYIYTSMSIPVYVRAYVHAH